MIRHQQESRPLLTIVGKCVQYPIDNESEWLVLALATIYTRVTFHIVEWGTASGAETEKRSSFAPDRNQAVTALYRSRDGTVWGGGAEQLWILGKAGPEQIPRPAGVPANSLVLTMVEDAAGSLWVNFGSNGLHKWSAGLWSLPDGLPKVAESSAIALASDAQGRIWVGFANGKIAIITSGKARFFEQGQGQPIGAISQILPVHDGAWIGGENSLGYFDGKRLFALAGKGAIRSQALQDSCSGATAGCGSMEVTAF